MFPILNSSRLVLRQHEISDVDSYFRIMSDETVVRFYGKYPLDNINEVYEDFKLFNDKFSKGYMIKWALEIRDSNEYVGSIGAFGLNSPHFKATISCVLDKGHWGNGVAKEGLLTVIQFLFSNTQINRIQLYVDPENIRAVSLFRHIGFRQEGLLREYEFEYGHAVDLLIMSILRKEWKKNESF